jgi:hypothetical protein
MAVYGPLHMRFTLVLYGVSCSSPVPWCSRDQFSPFGPNQRCRSVPGPLEALRPAWGSWMTVGPFRLFLQGYVCALTPNSEVPAANLQSAFRGDPV